MFQNNQKNSNNSSSTDCTVTHKKLLNISTETYLWMNFVNLIQGILQNTNTQLIFEPNAIYIQGQSEDQIRIAVYKIEYIGLNEFEMVYLLKDNKTLKSYRPYIQLIYSKFYKDLFLQYRGTCLFIKDKLIKEQNDLRRDTNYRKGFDIEIAQSMVVAWVPKRRGDKILSQFNRWIAEYNQSINFTPTNELRPTINRSNFNDHDPTANIMLDYADFVLFYAENDIEEFQLQNKSLIKLMDNGWQIELIIKSHYQQHCQQTKLDLEQILNQQYIELYPLEISSLSDDINKFVSDLEGILQKRCMSPIRLYQLSTMVNLSKEIDGKFETKILSYIKRLGYQECIFVSKKGRKEEQGVNDIIKEVIDLRIKYNQVMEKKKLLQLQKQQQESMVLFQQQEVSLHLKQYRLNVQNEHFILTAFDDLISEKLRKNVFNYNDFEQYLATNFNYHYNIEVLYRHQKLDFVIQLKSKETQIRQNIVKFISEYLNYEMLLIMNNQNVDFIERIKEKYDCDILTFRSKTCARGVVETYNLEYQQIDSDNDGEAIVFHITHLLHSNKQVLIQDIKSMLNEIEVSEIQKNDIHSEEDSLLNSNQTIIMQLTESQMKLINDENIEVIELKKGENCLEETFWVSIEGKQESIAKALSQVMSEDEKFIQSKLKEQLIENKQETLCLIEKSQQMEIFKVFNQEHAYQYYKELRMVKLNIRLSTEQYIYSFKQDENKKFYVDISMVSIPTHCLTSILPILQSINDNAILLESYDKLQSGVYFIGIVKGVFEKSFKLASLKNKYLITTLIRIKQNQQ